MNRAMKIAAASILAVFVSSLVLAGCMAGVKVNPGVVVEKSTEGPEGKTTEKAFYGGQLLEVTSGAESPASNIPAAITAAEARARREVTQAEDRIASGIGRLAWAFGGVLAVFLVGFLIFRKAA